MERMAAGHEPMTKQWGAVRSGIAYAFGTAGLRWRSSHVSATTGTSRKPEPLSLRSRRAS